MLAYNHEKYVVEAVRSVLRQQTSFPIELVVNEDCSSDRTREILVDLQRQSAGTMRLFLSDRNRGAVETFRDNLRACRGEYVALLDADDYWTDTRKLQMQADFLDRHPECALCFHNAWAVYEEGNHPRRLYYRDDGRRILDVTDLLARNFIPSCSVVARNRLFAELPEWVLQLGDVGDWPFYILSAEHGSIGYLDEVMGIYRVHGQGSWSGRDKTQRLKRLVAIYETFRANLESRHAGAIQAALSACYIKLSRHHEQSGDVQGARRCARKAFVAAMFSRRSGRKELLARALHLYAPRLGKAARWARSVREGIRAESQVGR